MGSDQIPGNREKNRDLKSAFRGGDHLTQQSQVLSRFPQPVQRQEHAISSVTGAAPITSERGRLARPSFRAQPMRVALRRNAHGEERLAMHLPSPTRNARHRSTMSKSNAPESARDLCRCEGEPLADRCERLSYKAATNGSLPHNRHFSAGSSRGRKGMPSCSCHSKCSSQLCSSSRCPVATR